MFLAPLGRYDGRIGSTVAESYQQLFLLAPTKRCSCCHNVKPLVAFHAWRYSRDGHRAQCKICLSRKSPETVAAERKRNTLAVAGLQVCRVCNEVKPMDAFSVRSENGKPRRECKACRTSVAAIYVETNRVKVAARRHHHYENNRSRISTDRVEYHAKHRNRLNAYARQWRRDNPEHVRSLNAGYRRRKPEVIKVCGQRRRARLMNADGNVTTQEWAAQVAYFDHRCAYCGCYLDRPTMEHMMPLSKGGPHVIENIVPACAPCNSRKSDRDLIGFLTFQAADEAASGLAAAVAQKVKQ